MPGITVVGAAHIDRIGRLDKPAFDGASVPGSFTEAPGGAGLNVASNLAVTGVRVSFSSIVGNDPSGDAIQKLMDERGIRAHLQIGNAKTATYTAILQSDGDLVIALADMEVYRAFEARCVTTALLQPGNTKWLVMDANLEPASLEELAKGAPASCKIGVLTVSSAKAPRLRKCLDMIDVLFTNRPEALALAGKDVTGTMDNALKALRELQVTHAVVSDGGSPLVVLDDEEVIRIPVTKPPSIQDVTGAGDALAAGTLAGLMEGFALPQAVHSGIAAAQAILQVDGPWRNDLAEAMDSIAADENEMTPL